MEHNSSSNGPESTPNETKIDLTDWIFWHIPYRLRCFWAEPPSWSPREPVERFRVDAIGEGQRTALRWLIEFVGVKYKEGSPVNINYRNTPRTDILIVHFKGCDVFSKDNVYAKELAEAWKAVSIFTSHSTDVSKRHLGIRTPHKHITRLAFELAVDHIDKCIYSKINLCARDVAMDHGLWGPVSKSLPKRYEEAKENAIKQGWQNPEELTKTD